MRTAGRPRRLLASAACAAVTLVASLARAESPFDLVSTVGSADELVSIGLSHRDPNFVMVGTGTGKLHRSTDGGATWQEAVVTPFRDLFFGRERSDDPRAEYALGLPGKSPHLQSWLRGKGLHTSGIRLQQLLVLKGDRSARINWIEVDWHDENRVFAGTSDGLYRSLDKGRTFARIWQGWTGAPERMINTVATDPADPKTLMLGTARGLFVSRDRGGSFAREMEFYIRDSYITALYFDARAPGLIHMAMGGAAMASPDSGKTWITTHWDEYGPRSDVQWLSLGPDNLRAMGTRDGVFASWQGGEMGSWKRRGRRFVGETVTQVLITQRAPVWYALTDMGVWRTTDHGENWAKVMQMGGREVPRWITAFDGDESQLWLLTNRHLYRLGGVMGMITGPDAEAAPRKILDLPSLEEFWRKVMAYKHLYFADHQRYRDRAPWASLLPFVVAGVNVGPSRDERQIQTLPYVQWPYRFWNRLSDETVAVEVFAMWDLSSLVFDRRQMPQFGRIARNIDGLRDDLTERISRLYAEYRRVATTLVTRPPEDALKGEYARIRLQEIAAFFDAVSGGYWTRVTGGVP